MRLNLNDVSAKPTRQGSPMIPPGQTHSPTVAVILFSLVLYCVIDHCIVLNDSEK